MIHIVHMPRLGANIDKVKILSWNVKVGDSVTKGQTIASLETDKANFDLECEESGIIRYINVNPDTEVTYNFPLAIISNSDEDITKTIEDISKKNIKNNDDFIEQMDKSVFEEINKEKIVLGKKEIPLTPLAKKLIEDNKIDKSELSSIKTKSSRGVITEQDIENWIKLPKTFIYGASTGAKQIIEILNHTDNGFRISGIIDDNNKLFGKNISSYKVLGGIEYLTKNLKNTNFSVLISSHSNSRKKIFKNLIKEISNIEFPSIIDNRSIIYSNCSIGDGILIEAGCLIGHEVKLERGVILNLGVKISHNCVIGEFTHLAIGSIISGAVRIGSNCLVGAGTAINPAVKIGNNVIITPGSAVVNDIPDNVIVSGNPAKIIGDSKR